MPPAVHVDPAPQYEYLLVRSRVVAAPRILRVPQAGWCGRHVDVGRHQVVLVNVALRRLQVAQVSCGSTFVAEARRSQNSQSLRWTKFASSR